MKKIKVNHNIRLQLKTSKKRMRCIESGISLILVEKILEDFNKRIKRGDYIIAVRYGDGNKLYVIDEETFQKRLMEINPKVRR